MRDLTIIESGACRATTIGMFLILFVTHAGCGPTTENASHTSEAPWFRDVTVGAGVDFSHVRGDVIRYWFPEIMSGGGAWIDYDVDGDLDLYLIQGGALDSTAALRPRNQLFRNRGNGTFENATATAGVGDDAYGMGCAVGDYDKDGDPDLYVTNVGEDVLYQNRGDGTFIDVTKQAGLGDAGWGSSTVFVDYDNDGNLDLFVVRYVEWSPEREISCFAGGNERDYCQPENYSSPATDRLYRNNGDGTFEDVTTRAGITRAQGNGLGVAFGDFNGDGWVDLYVANDGNANQLWMNNGDGTFHDEALMSGSAVNRQGMAEAGMGVVAADVENDGDLDLFMTHLRGETNTLYRNRNGLFEDATASSGLSAASIPYTGFGVGMLDFDHDGLIDVFVANGRVGRTLASLGDDPYGEPDQVFRGLGNGAFEEVRAPFGEDGNAIHTSRAAVFGDYDDDGDVDVAVVNNGGPVRLLQNQVNGGAWIRFRVRDQHGRDAIGARVMIVTSTAAQWRLVSPAYGYQSSNEIAVHFGLGKPDVVDEVVVVWPGGREEAFGPFRARAMYDLVQGRGSER